MEVESGNCAVMFRDLLQGNRDDPRTNKAVSCVWKLIYVNTTDLLLDVCASSSKDPPHSARAVCTPEFILVLSSLSTPHPLTTTPLHPTPLNNHSTPHTLITHSTVHTLITHSTVHLLTPTPPSPTPTIPCLWSSTLSHAALAHPAPLLFSQPHSRSNLSTFTPPHHFDSHLRLVYRN
ncbi:hypothetical protein Pmani_009131 [Petrolisthes manimaculis]|uniref:Uncharacterized protein n=1 Tax=Petrolisthes manimaculis TaxID=1843537 RepID=A0AAE1Q713_9EUCA|nr:hypothetical protein Pmani_009131 [Petrolisthes manimaculis]